MPGIEAPLRSNRITFCNSDSANEIGSISITAWSSGDFFAPSSGRGLIVPLPGSSAGTNGSLSLSTNPGFGATKRSLSLFLIPYFLKRDNDTS